VNQHLFNLLEINHLLRKNFRRVSQFIAEDWVKKCGIKAAAPITPSLGKLSSF
jgi:hypothetical protein